jgi:hypothetical protein
MADYEKDGQVSNTNYCMKDSMQAKNVDMMNKGLKYNDLADLANTKAFPVNMVGATRNEQEGPKAADNRYNYDKNR